MPEFRYPSVSLMSLLQHKDQQNVTYVFATLLKKKEKNLESEREGAWEICHHLSVKNVITCKNCIHLLPSLSADGKIARLTQKQRFSGLLSCDLVANWNK